jgi:glycine C-acetyltransferase/8-amino-7-oxononanoate synthase
MVDKSFINKELNNLKDQNLFRSTRNVEAFLSARIKVDGKEYINFSSNNYLGLAQHPQVIEKTINTLKSFGASAQASRLISGNTIIHEKLEKELASFKNREDCLVFPTGVMTNLGVITSLVGDEDVVMIDRLNHASIVDACRYSNAKLMVYSHKDTRALDRLLRRSVNYRRRLVVTDSVFSMDGDIAPLPEIVDTAKKYDAMVMVDEAHATGVIGEEGRGIEEHFDLHGKVDIVMGTLSKALGSLGGFVAGDKNLIQYLKNRSRNFIYTTGLPPHVCSSALAALEIISSDFRLVNKLQKNAKYLRTILKESGLELFGDNTPIISVLIYDVKNTIEMSKKLMDLGFYVLPIRPPTVPKGLSRIRITVTAMHTKEDLDALGKAVRSVASI